jgi:CubicO group peptidase (beta-lactamase class C family)
LKEPVVVLGAPARSMALAERMRALHVPGVSIAMINHGKIEWARAYGIADAQTSRPVTTNTLFQVGSVSKPVAAVTVMRLVAQGKIDLDEAVNLRLRAWQVPASPPMTAQHPVTARALLSHTAGMPRTNLLGYLPRQPQPTLLQVLQGAAPAANAAVQVSSVPGSEYGYSSLGYAALQQFVSDALGRPFEQLAREQVFAPLGMHDSIYAMSLPSELAGRAAAGHRVDGSVLDGKWRNHPELAAAGLWSTASDLARLVIAIQCAAQASDTSFLTQTQTMAMLAPVLNDYGLGFELDHTGLAPAFHHSGSNIGFKALLYAYTKTGQGVVILTNGDLGWTLIEEIMRSIATEYDWDDYRPVERIATPAKVALLDRFVGDFSVSNITLHITRQNNAIYVSGPPIGPAPAELIPFGDYDYFLREKAATLHFDANEANPVETLSFFDGKQRPGKRVVPANSPSAEPMNY